MPCAARPRTAPGTLTCWVRWACVTPTPPRPFTAPWQCSRQYSSPDTASRCQISSSVLRCRPSWKLGIQGRATLTRSPAPASPVTCCCASSRVWTPRSPHSTLQVLPKACRPACLSAASGSAVTATC
ncbi:hypothetical protein GWK47_009124 [Chionoecetes opilio]|uniref:Uncharacterized protein n=1 Tax=Chionoecetes opilio TaxID=41210 RepID=A0A8J4XX53_CHIOP|nr:hypothetical protein GWK47_009124 [Chionoecetes opilio]